MKCRMLVLLLTGSSLCALGCDGEDGIGPAGLGGKDGWGSGGTGGGGSGGTGGGGSDSIPTCSGAFSACGGDLAGKWALDGLCVEGDFKSILSDSEGLPPECADAIEDLTIQASGTIEFAYGMQKVDVTRVMEMKVKYTSACVSAMGDRPTVMDQTACQKISSNIENSDDEDSETTGSCSYSGGVCNCTIRIDGREQSSTGYTVSGNKLTTEDGDSVEFCVSGNNLTVREESSSDLSGQTKLHRL